MKCNLELELPEVVEDASFSSDGRLHILFSHGIVRSYNMTNQWVCDNTLMITSRATTSRIYCEGDRLCLIHDDYSEKKVNIYSTVGKSISIEYIPIDRSNPELKSAIDKGHWYPVWDGFIVIITPQACFLNDEKDNFAAFSPYCNFDNCRKLEVDSIEVILRQQIEVIIYFEDSWFCGLSVEIPQFRFNSESPKRELHKKPAGRLSILRLGCLRLLNEVKTEQYRYLLLPTKVRFFKNSKVYCLIDL